VRERNSEFVLVCVCVCVRTRMRALYMGGCAHAFLQTIYCGYSSANVGTKSGGGGEKKGKRLENWAVILILILCVVLSNC
jgi:hypothetical protein